MKSNLLNNKEYTDWLKDIKSRIYNAQLKAAVKVNTEMLTLYWELGADIVQKQSNAKWGDSFLVQLSRDLTAEFPDVKGFSLSNLKYIKQWYKFYSRKEILSQQPVGLIAKQPVSQLPANQISQQPVDQFVQRVIAQIPWRRYLSAPEDLRKAMRS
jgi:hypothetical protein